MYLTIGFWLAWVMLAFISYLVVYGIRHHKLPMNMDDGLIDEIMTDAMDVNMPILERITMIAVVMIMVVILSLILLFATIVVWPLVIFLLLIFFALPRKKQ